MRRATPIALAFLLLTACPGPNATNNATTTDDHLQRHDHRDDPHAFYRTEGNYYVMKSLIQVGKPEPQTTYFRYEIVEVRDTVAVYRVTTLDEQMRPVPNIDPEEHEREFVAEGSPVDWDEGDWPAPTYEEIEFEGRKYTCLRFESVSSGTSWIYKGVVMKRTDSFSYSEIVELQLDE